MSVEDLLVEDRVVAPARVASASEIKARWAFSEIASSRYSNSLVRYLPQQIVEHARAGMPFEELSSEDLDILVTAQRQSRPAEFVDYVDRFGAPQYELINWTIRDLLNSITVPTLGTMQYFRWLAMPSEMDPGTQKYLCDPRPTASRIPFDETFRVGEGLIAVRLNGHDLLIDGYLRSLLWLRNTSYPLPVWVPAESCP